MARWTDDGVGPAVTQEQVVRRLARSMVRTATPVGAAVWVLGIGVAWLLAGTPGVYGAAAGGSLALVAIALTPLLMRVTATSTPMATLGVIILGTAVKVPVLFVVLQILRDIAVLDRMALALTMIAVLIATSAAEAWAGYRLDVLIGTLPSPAPPSGDAWEPHSGSA